MMLMACRFRLRLFVIATASVDMVTDAHIQSLTLTLPATVLLIAHRLSSVMDLDLVLMMDEARVVEFDTPSKLMQKSGSRFAQLAQQSQTNQQSM
jgi:ABC-type multidrug transport system fused ATPase/permease subunit